MARLHLVALFDRVSESFLPPFVAPTMGVAERMMRDELQNPESELAKHVQDYELVELGIYDSADGTIWSERGIYVGKDEPRREGGSVITTCRVVESLKNLLPVKS